MAISVSINIQQTRDDDIVYVIMCLQSQLLVEKICLFNIGAVYFCHYTDLLT